MVHENGIDPFIDWPNPLRTARIAYDRLRTSPVMAHLAKPWRIALLLGVIASLLGLGLYLSRTPEPPLERLGTAPADRESAGPEWVAQQVPCTPGQGEEFSTRVPELVLLTKVVKGIAGWAKVEPGYPVIVASNGTTEGYYELTVDISDSVGRGQFRLLVGPFEGTPVAMADFVANATGDCAPVRRLIRPDGTVLQLYRCLKCERM